MLTHLAATVPPRIGHFIARLLGISAALREFCPCGTCGSAWGDESPLDELTRLSAEAGLYGDLGIGTSDGAA